MALDGLSPWYFSLGILIPNAPRIKTSCNCCGIQDCCTLSLLTVQQGKCKEKTTLEKLLCQYAVNWLSLNASSGSWGLSSGYAHMPKIRNEPCPRVQFSKALIQRCQREKKISESETFADFIRIKPSVFCGLRFGLFLLFI